MERAPDLPITFGICVGPEYTAEWLQNLIKSIRLQNIPEYEILIVRNDHTYTSFEENCPDIINHKCHGWLPHKKNLIAREATYENLCIVHDYYQFDDNWYEGLTEFCASAEKYKKKWSMLGCYVQRLEDGERGPDWVINPFHLKKFLDQPENADILRDIQAKYPDENHPMYVVGLSPFEERFSLIQYNSGGYIFCKRNLLLAFPFNETLKPGEAEDIEWCNRLQLYSGFKLRFNPFSIVYTQKPNKWKVYPFPPEYYDRLYIAVSNGLYTETGKCNVLE